MRSVITFLFISTFVAVVVSSDSKCKESFAANDGNIIFIPYVENGLFCMTVVAKTRGCIGWGISRPGDSTKADACICGVDDDSGKPYCRDYYRESMGAPTYDTTQNLKAIGGYQSKTHTTVTCCRPMKPTEEDKYQDVEVKLGETYSFIWSRGKNDTLTYHGAERGRMDIKVCK